MGTELLLIIGAAAFAGFFGYVFGAAGKYKEAQLKAYSEIIPAVARLYYRTGLSGKEDAKPSNEDIKTFNECILKSWLFANRSAALSLNQVLSRMVDSKRGDAGEQLRLTISLMRSNVLPWWHKLPCHSQRIKPEEITHTQFTN